MNGGKNDYFCINNLNIKMKRLLLLATISLLLGSCASSTVSGTKVKSTYGTRTANKAIKGDWVLNSISYDQSGKFDVTLFSDTSKECFEGSTWKFVPNNFRGTYTINAPGCSGGDRHFIFVVQEIDKTTGYYDFLLKPTNEKYKSETNAGVRLNLSYLSDTEMEWKQTVRVDGKPFVITMKFGK